MRITIDVSQIVYDTGVSVYTRNLVNSLLQVDKEDNYVLFGGSLRRGEEIRSFYQSLSLKAENFVGKIFPFPPTLADFIWNRLHQVPIEKLVGQSDVFHSSDWTQPPSRSFKVTTIHDLSPILFPKLTDPKVVKAHKSRLEIVRREVDRILVPSETTKKDCVKLGFDPVRLRVIPEAVEPGYKPAKTDEILSLKKKYRISGKYLLSVGVNDRKNTKRIIYAFEKIKPELDVKLVIVGYPYSKFDGTKGVIFTGHVSRLDLRILYSGALALVYPSLYEGFGLPILEAFTCRTPVITSNTGSMAEVARDAAVLVEPTDSDSIASGILKAIRDRKMLVKSGERVVADFSWTKTARETVKVYKEAFG